MRKQFLDMRQDYSEQLEQIEKAFLRERNDIIQQNDVEIKGLLKNHKKLEEEYSKIKHRKEEEYHELIEGLKTQDANDQAEQKIKLEKEMQTLQKCMEDMKAVYRLNEEKLDFNHKVLKDREAVNRTTIEGLKKKQRKMKNILRNVKEKFEIQSKKFVKDNKHMTKE